MGWEWQENWERAQLAMEDLAAKGNRWLLDLPEGMSLRWRKLPAGLIQCIAIQAYHCDCEAARFLEQRVTILRETVQDAKCDIRAEIEGQLLASLKEAAVGSCPECFSEIALPVSYDR